VLENIDMESAPGREHLVVLLQALRESLEDKNSSNLLIEADRDQLPPVQPQGVNQPPASGFEHAPNPLVVMQINRAKAFNTAAQGVAPRPVCILSPLQRVNYPVPSLACPRAAQRMVLGIE
jgi:hypothetical protein